MLSDKKRLVLISLREKENLKQSDIAKVLNVSTSYYGMIEQGVRTPSLELALRLSKFFNKTIEEIFLSN